MLNTKSNNEYNELLDVYRLKSLIKIPNKNKMRNGI